MKTKQPKKYEGMSWLNHGCYPGFTMFSFGMEYDGIMAMLKRKKAIDWITGISESKELINNGHNFALKRRVQNKEGENITLFYIIIKEFNFTDIDYCILAHEVLHIVNFSLQQLLNRDDEFEAEAYFHTHLMQQCLHLLRGNK